MSAGSGKYATIGTPPPHVSVGSPRSSPRNASPGPLQKRAHQRPKQRGHGGTPRSAPRAPAHTSGGSGGGAAASKWLAVGAAATSVASAARQATLTELVTTVARGEWHATVLKNELGGSESEVACLHDALRSAAELRALSEKRAGEQHAELQLQTRLVEKLRAELAGAEHEREELASRLGVAMQTGSGWEERIKQVTADFEQRTEEWQQQLEQQGAKWKERVDVCRPRGTRALDCSRALSPQPPPAAHTSSRTPPHPSFPASPPPTVQATREKLLEAQQRALEQAELLQEATRQRDEALNSNDALKDVRAALAERDAQLAERDAQLAEVRRGDDDRALDPPIKLLCSALQPPRPPMSRCSLSRVLRTGVCARRRQTVSRRSRRQRRSPT